MGWKFSCGDSDVEAVCVDGEVRCSGVVGDFEYGEVFGDVFSFYGPVLGEFLCEGVDDFFH